MVNITGTIASSIFMVLSSLIFFLGINTHSNPSLFLEWNALELQSTTLSAVILIDWVSCYFISTVLLISSIVLLYSNSYIVNDSHIYRFMFLVVGFVISINLLIIIPNLISILLGWDGLGLISYLLVIFYNNNSSINAGILTVLSNRIGDVIILMTIGVWISQGNLNFTLCANPPLVKLTSALIILASITNSAQIPFSAWLPAAIAAPTPVSSLVHSSTLVTAGVYLIIRFSFILEDNQNTNWLFIFSTLTILISGYIANLEIDINNIIALSTLSQLGLIISILSVSATELAYFHLLTHALFNALLFLCAGYIIHSTLDSQDVRLLGSLSINIPLISALLLFTNLSLCGIPFLSGFYSNDLIFETINAWNLNPLIIILWVVAIVLTTSYSLRILLYTLSFPWSGSPTISFSTEDWNIITPILFLSVASVISGASLSWIILPCPQAIILSSFSNLSIIFLILLGLLSALLFNFFLNNSSSNINNSIWGLHPISTIFTNNSLNPTTLINTSLDMGWSESYGGIGASIYVDTSSNFLYSLINWNWTNSLLSILITLIILWAFL